MQRKGQWLLGTLCVMILSACATTPTTGTANDAKSNPFCAVDRIITFSAMQDSMETVAQVRKHNAIFQSVCIGS